MYRQTPDWAQIRDKEFSLNPDYVYLNNSTFGATLNRVMHRAQQVAGMFGQGCRLEQFADDIIPAMSKIRQNIASLVHAGPTAEIGIVNSATEAMSLIANGLTFGRDDRILITDHEHTGNETMWRLQVKRYHANISPVPLFQSGEEGDRWKTGLIGRFSEKIAAGRVKAMSIPWCTTSTGHILPVKELCALAKEHGVIAVIDATQLFGVKPLDFQDTGCDFLVMNGHKYLGGPIGSGFIVAKQEMTGEPAFFPTVVDSNVYGGRGYLPCSKGGILPYTSILPLLEAIEFYRDLHPEVVYRRLLAIGQWLRNGLANNRKKINLITPRDEKYSCIMTSFTVNGMASRDVVKMLLEEGIVVKEAIEGGTKCIRISPHYWNTVKEFDHLTSALSKVADVDKTAWTTPPI